MFRPFFIEEADSDSYRNEPLSYKRRVPIAIGMNPSVISSF